MERDQRSQRQLALQVWHRMEGPDRLLQQNPTVWGKEGGGRREHPDPGPRRSAWTMAPGCTVTGTAQLVPRASSRHPAGHGPRTQRRTPGRMGRGIPLGWGRVLGLPRALRSGRTQDGWRHHPGEAGGAADCASLPKASGSRRWGCPPAPVLPHPPGNPGGAELTTVRRPRPPPGSLLHHPPGSPPDTRSAGLDGSAGDTSRSRGAVPHGSGAPLGRAALPH